MRSVSRRRPRSLVVLFAVMAAVGGVSIGSVAAAPAVHTATTSAAAANSFTMASGANFQPNPARGSIVAFFFTNPVTTEPARDLGGVDVTPGGVWIQTNDCRDRAPIKRLPILYISPRQANVYLPNGLGNEKYGTCDNSGTDMITVHQQNGEEFTQSQPTPAVSPGVFRGNGGAGPAPEGWLHIVATNDYVRLSECDTLSRCPYRTGGTMNEVIVLMTGAELFTGYDPGALNQNRVLFTLNGPGIANVTQPLSSLGQQEIPDLFGFTHGIELATMTLTGFDNPSAGAGAYQLTMFTTVAPFTQPPLEIRLSAAN